MAAPVVSGALAVLKSRFRNLNAKQAVDILLRTATDLGAPGTDPVYGRGLVNLERALQPIGQQNAASGTGRGVAASADTRIAFSSTFGNAAPSARHHFGGFDSYGRVYRYRAPLQDRVMPGPRLSGVLALNGAAGPVRMAGGDGTTALLRRSTTPESVIGDGTAVTLIGTRHRTGLAIASSRTSVALSPAALIPQGGEGQAGTPPTPVWQGLAPRAGRRRHPPRRKLRPDRFRCHGAPWQTGWRRAGSAWPNDQTGALPWQQARGRLRAGKAHKVRLSASLGKTAAERPAVGRGQCDAASRRCGFPA